jgi:poly(3-hydroxybutyrate) depolymerase
LTVKLRFCISLAILAALALQGGPSFSQNALHNPPKSVWTGRETLTWIDGNREARAVDIYVPKKSAKGRQFPIVMWMMGSRSHVSKDYQYLGMCYNDCDIAPYAEKNGFILVVIDERHVKGKTWEIVDRDTVDETLTLDVLAYVKKTFPVDATRVYLWGLSAGGKFAQYMAAKHSDTFTAVCSAAGVIDDFDSDYFNDMVNYIKNTPRKFPIVHYQTAGDYESLIKNMKGMLRLYKESGYPVVERVWFPNDIPGRFLRHEWYADLYNQRMWDWCKKFQVVDGKTVVTGRE